MEEEDTKLCEGCLKTFPQKVFLIHVTRKPDCKNHYKDQLDSMKAHAIEISKGKVRENRYKKYEGQGIEFVACEKCKKSFYQNTLLKHLVKSQVCKAHYGSKFDDLIQYGKDLKAVHNAKQNLKKYHKLSKDQKAAIVEKQREKRKRVEEDRRQKMSENHEQEQKRMTQYFKTDFSQSVKTNNKSSRKLIVDSIGKLDTHVKNNHQKKALEILREMAKVTFDNLEEMIDKTILEVRDSTSMDFVFEKFNLFMAVGNQMVRRSPMLVQKEWDNMKREVEATSWKYFKIRICLKCAVYKNQVLHCPKCLKEKKKKQQQAGHPRPKPYNFKRLPVTFTMQDLENEVEERDDEDFHE